MLTSRLFALVVLVVVLAAPSVPQSEKTRSEDEANRDNKLFRLRGDLINFSEGDVSCLCGGEITRALPGQPLANGDAIQIKHGRAEILLTPGYFLRLGENTEVGLLDLSANNLRIKLLRGSAIVEIAVDKSFTLFDDWKERLFPVLTVNTSRDEFAIARGGIYRFNVESNGHSEVRVMKGALAVPGRILKEGNRAAVFAGTVEVSALQGKSNDELDNWSHDRAIALLRSNKSLKKREWSRLMRNGGAYLDISAPDAVNESASTHIISALAGVVEFAESGTFIKHPDSSWQEFNSEKRLSDGDRLRTNVDARAEVRPYPNFYLFMGGDSEIGYGENDQGEVTISVKRGSVIVTIPENNVSARQRSYLTMRAENAEYHIGRSGFYRMNVPAGGVSEMIVRQGALDTASGKIGAPKRVLNNGSGVVSSFDRNIVDSLDVWSDHRFARYELSGQWAARLLKFWYQALWFFDEETNQFTLLPGNRFYKSPYGGDYSVSYSSYTAPRRIAPFIR